MSKKGRNERVIYSMSMSYVEPPFVDGANVWVESLGDYTSLENARAWLQGPGFREIHPVDSESRIIEIKVIARAMDVGPQSWRRSHLISLRGELLSTRRDDGEEPWAGREPETCRWKRGDLAACVSGKKYRVGVILAPPLAPAWARRLKATRMDDVYLIGFADDFDHEHPSEARLVQPFTDVSDALRSRLAKRLAEYHYDEYPPP